MIYPDIYRSLIVIVAIIFFIYTSYRLGKRAGSGLPTGNIPDGIYLILDIRVTGDCETAILFLFDQERDEDWLYIYEHDPAVCLHINDSILVKNNRVTFVASNERPASASLH